MNFTPKRAVHPGAADTSDSRLYTYIHVCIYVYICAGSLPPD